MKNYRTTQGGREMTNKEKYKKEILDFLIKSSYMAIDKKTGTVCTCDLHMGCNWCAFYDEDEDCCKEKRTKWLNEEYVETVETKVDWSKVPVDTPILVSDDRVHWYNRYFARFTKGKTWAWVGGTTSWSASRDTNPDSVSSWEYAKLAESEENK